MGGESKHTPGPWRVEDGTTLIWGNCNPDDHSTRGMGYPIAEARINPSGNWSTGPYADEGEANARLIAAAPDYFDVSRDAIVILEAVLADREEAIGEEDEVLCDLLDRFRTIQSRATGESS